MSIKEKPLIDAVEKLGPLPGWLFSHPFLAGFFAILMVPIFGAVFAAFWGTLGAPSAIELFDAAVFGAIAAMIFAGVILLGILISVVLIPDERRPRLIFALGGFVAMTIFFAITLMFYDDVSRWLIENNPPLWTGD